MIKKTIVVTGAAGFIGFHQSKAFAIQGHNVIAIDSLKPAYGGNLSELRWAELRRFSNVIQYKLDLLQVDLSELKSIIESASIIFHLAAFPGVRQSETNKEAYSQNNIQVFRRILEVSSNLNLEKLFFASSSSVYGNGASDGSSSELDAHGNNLRSFYSETKWQNELDAKIFRSNVMYPIIALRFFTVFGSFGRPDMAYWSFAQKIESGQKINLYGIDGGSRNFTFIDDVVKILLKLTDLEIESTVEALNIASGNPISAKQFAEKLMLSMNVPSIGFDNVARPNADVEKTWANTSKLERLIGEIPHTNIDKGVQNFIEWFKGQPNEIRGYKPI
jgi:UDP-glucuronate 4-epimerase